MTKPIPEFIQMLRYSTLLGVPHTLDLTLRGEWERAVQSVAEEMWTLAYTAGLDAAAREEL